MASTKSARNKPIHFLDGEILQVGGLARLFGCSEPIARDIAENTPGFPAKLVFGRGTKGWSRAQVVDWLKNPTARAVGDQ